MNEATKYFIASTLIAAFLAAPSWLPYLGIEPEWFGSWLVRAVQLFLPVITLAVGMFLGWRAHAKTGENERLAAEREDALRREREEREARAIEERKMRELEEEHERHLEERALSFMNFDYDAKVLACVIYDEGEMILPGNFDGDNGHFAAQASSLTHRETLPNGYYRFTLKPWARELIDSRPELISGVRAHIERAKRAKDLDATRANPKLMMPYMSVVELETLQKIVDGGGRFDGKDVTDAAMVETLEEFGMLQEYYDDITEPPIYELDRDVLAFFDSEENKDLIAAGIDAKLETL